MIKNKYYIATLTILLKEVIRFKRIWLQTIIPPIITTSLYFIIFGNLIGQRIGTMGGVHYVQYIVPGLIMMAIIQNAYANVSSSFFSAKFQKSIEEMLVAPIPHYLIILGYISGGIVRGIVVGFLVLLTALSFTHLKIQHPSIVLMTTLLSSTLFSLAGLLNGIYAKKFDDISVIPTFILTPLTYLGGVFYSIKALSPFWRNLSLVNPIVYIIDIFRYGMLGIADTPITAAIITVFCFTLFLFLACLYLLNRGIGLRT